MTYVNADAVPARYQWDADSRYPAYYPAQGNAPFNCGPTGVAFMAAAYTGHWFGITSTRRLVAPDYTPTNIIQQKTMLTLRGVSCYTSQPTVATMRTLVGSGRRPIMVGLYMALVPDAIRGHPFTGMHTVVLRKARTQNGVYGFDVLDPNFSPLSGRVDPYKGHRFYPSSVISAAFVESTVGGRSYALVPTALMPYVKPLPYCSIIDGARIRTGPGGQHPIYASGPKAKVRCADYLTTGGSWSAFVDGRWISGNRWRRVLVNQEWGFVIQPYAHLL